MCHYIDPASVPRGEKLRFPSSFTGAPNRMYRNNGDGTFTDSTDRLGVGGGTHRTLGMIATDLDNDRDIDLVVLNDDAPPQLFTNDRNDRFREIFRQAGPGIASAQRGLTVADFNRDGAMDFFLSGGLSIDFIPLTVTEGRNFLLLNQGNGLLQPDARSAPLLARASGLGSGVLDYDGDGDLDLYLPGADDGTGGSLWENAGDGSFNFAGRLTGFAAGGGFAAADLNGDGRADILALDSLGNPQVWQNEAANFSHWVAVQLEGLRSNKLGLGAKVEIRSGSLYQKFEVQGYGRHLSQDSQVVWLGLDSAKVDSITVRWPSGVLQSEINVAADRVARVKELDRKGTSCPLLYAWNGKQFEFVTDFLGGCAIGYLQAPGQYNTPDTDEYVRIEGRQLVPRDGKYRRLGCDADARRATGGDAGAGANRRRGKIEVIGARPLRVVVQPRAASLIARGLTALDVEERLRVAGSAVAAGRVREGASVRPLVVTQPIRSLEDLRALRVQGVPLGELADVSLREVADDTVFRTRDGEAVLLQVHRAPNANAVSLAREVKKRVRELSGRSAGVKIAVVNDRSEEVTRALFELAVAALLGVLLGTLVLRYMLGVWRPTLALAVVVPAALLASFSAFYFAGIQLDVISLAGLALATGLLVDNSIVVLESVESARAAGKANAVAAGTRQIVARRRGQLGHVDDRLRTVALSSRAGTRVVRRASGGCRRVRCRVAPAFADAHARARATRRNAHPPAQPGTRVVPPHSRRASRKVQHAR